MPPKVLRFSGLARDQPLRVKLFGVGSAGCSIIDNSQLPTVALSTSSDDLARSHAQRKVLVGPDRLVGIASVRHGLLKHLSSAVGHEILDMFNNTDLAFLMCGLGGLTGSLGSQVLASVCSAKGIPCIAITATPFSAESIRRREMASKAIEGLLKSSTLCLDFDNDKLSSLAPNMPLSRVFAVMNSIMMRPALDLLSSIPRSEVSLLVQALGDSNYGRFGLGLGRGDERVERAVAEAMDSPWFDFPLSDAGAAVVVYSSADPWDREAERIIELTGARLPGATIAFGSYADPMLNDRIRVSAIVARKRPA